MDKITDTLQRTIHINPEHQVQILKSILILIALGIIRYVILRIVWKLTEDPKMRYTWKRTVSLIIGILMLILIGSVWMESIGKFGAFLGLLSAGIAIALKDMLTNVAGWIFILARKPFSIGDRVQIGENAGDVIDIRIFQFSLMEIGNWVNADQSTGRIIHMPNGVVFTKPQANYSAGFNYIWNEISVLVTFESQWELAKSILENIIHEHSEKLSLNAEKKIIEASKKYMIFYQYLTPIVYTSVEPSGILLTLRFICDPRKRRSNEHEVWEEILKEFAKHKDIEFAYPTQRFFTRPAEKNDSPL